MGSCQSSAQRLTKRNNKMNYFCFPTCMIPYCVIDQLYRDWTERMRQTPLWCRPHKHTHTHTHTAYQCRWQPLRMLSPIWPKSGCTHPKASSHTGLYQRWIRRRNATASLTVYSRSLERPQIRPCHLAAPPGEHKLIRADDPKHPAADRPRQLLLLELEWLQLSIFSLFSCLFSWDLR